MLWLGTLSGTPGTNAGRALFLHETRKQPFSRPLHAVTALQLLLAGAICLPLGG